VGRPLEFDPVTGSDAAGPSAAEGPGWGPTHVAQARLEECYGKMYEQGCGI